MDKLRRAETMRSVESIGKGGGPHAEMVGK
jgi:hypothetical protein